MNATKFTRVTLPVLALTPGERVSSIASAPKGVAVRVLIRNNSGVLAFLSTASEMLIGADAPGSDVYELPPLASDVIILAPGQSLYAAGNGAGGMLSMSISEALPESSARI